MNRTPRPALDKARAKRDLDQQQVERIYDGFRRLKERRAATTELDLGDGHSYGLYRVVCTHQFPDWGTRVSYCKHCGVKALFNMGHWEVQR